MSELAILAASAKVSLQAIAKQAQALGVGLENAAPPEKSGSFNPSVQYLLAVAEQLSGLATACEQFESQF